MKLLMINIFLSDIFETTDMLLSQRFHKTCQAAYVNENISNNSPSNIL